MFKERCRQVNVRTYSSQDSRKIEILFSFQVDETSENLFFHVPK